MQKSMIRLCPCNKQTNKLGPTKLKWEEHNWIVWLRWGKIVHNLQPDLKTVSLGLAVVFCAVAVLCFIEEKKIVI